MLEVYIFFRMNESMSLNLKYEEMCISHHWSVNIPTYGFIICRCGDTEYLLPAL